jgi:hypothetical protein
MGTAMNWFFRRRGSPAKGNLALAAMMAIILLSVHSALVVFSPILSSKKLADALRAHYQPGDRVVVRGLYENASTLNFYTGIHLLTMHQPTGNMWYGAKFPDAPPVWLTPEQFAPMWRGPGRVFLWTDREDPPETVGSPPYVVARSGGKLLYTNRPL